MSRPQHLNVPNTPAGIRRINEMQSHYDEDPGTYEAEEKARDEERMREEEERNAQYEAERQQEEEQQ